MSAVRVAPAVLLVLVLGSSPAVAASGQAIEVALRAVGHTDLGGGSWDDVAVVGTTAIVSPAAGTSCGPSAAAVVDLKDPRRPRPVATVPAAGGLAVVAVAAAAVAVAAPAFTGDLAAVAVRSCAPGAAGAGVVYYDVTVPSRPRLLGRLDRAAARSVSVAARKDGRVIAAVVSGDGAGVVLALDDVTDPTRPQPVGRWAPSAAPGAARCPEDAADVELADTGDRAMVTVPGGDVYDLDLSEPAGPVVAGRIPARPGGGRARDAVALPVGRRTLAVVAEDDAPGGGCTPGTDGRGLRLLNLAADASPSDAGEVRLPSPAAPGRLVASGELAFVAWHGDGLRVVDLGQVAPRTVAQFVPAATGETADVVAVALAGDHLAVTDRRSGLYLLERPAEGHRESIWDRVKSSIPFVAVPLILATVMTVPRLAMGRSPATSRSPSPVAARAPRRRR